MKKQTINNAQTTDRQLNLVFILFSMILWVEKKIVRLRNAFLERRLQDAKYKVKKYELIADNPPSRRNEAMIIMGVVMVAAIISMVVNKHNVVEIIILSLILFILGTVDIEALWMKYDAKYDTNSKRYRHLVERQGHLDVLYRQSEVIFYLMMAAQDEYIDADDLLEEYSLL